MNTKTVYATAGGIAAVAIAIFFVLGQGQGNLSFLRTGQNMQNTIPQNQSAQALQLTINKIAVNKTSNNNANVQVIFNVSNPNKSTVTLETIHYTVYIGQFKMTSGDIGTSPEGFVAGQENVFPIIPDSAITLKDTQRAVRNNLTANSWDSMVEGNTHYRVEGTYSFRTTSSSFQTGYYEKDFTLTFP